jgi:hypothetical protein
MTRLAWAFSLAVLIGCGEKPEPEAKKPAAPPPATPKPPEIKSDPTGKNTCVKCALKTNEDVCPKCKTPLKAAVAPATSTAPKTHAEVGKSAVGGVYACPEPGCTFSEPKKGTCLKHTTTQMKEQWFVCEKCSKKEPLAGKCGGCGAELVRKLY